MSKSFDQILSELTKYQEKYTTALPPTTIASPPPLSLRNSIKCIQGESFSLKNTIPEREMFLKERKRYLYRGFRTEIWIVVDTNIFIDYMELLESIFDTDSDKKLVEGNKLLLSIVFYYFIYWLLYLDGFIIYIGGVARDVVLAVAKQVHDELERISKETEAAAFHRAQKKENIILPLEKMQAIFRREREKQVKHWNL